MAGVMGVIGRRWTNSNLVPQMNPFMRIRCCGFVEVFQREWLGELHALAVPGACMGFAALFGFGYAFRVWSTHAETTFSGLIPVQLQYWSNPDEYRTYGGGKDTDETQIKDYYIIFGRKQNLGTIAMPFLDVLDKEAKSRGKDGVNMAAVGYNRLFTKSVANNVEQMVLAEAAKKA